jgi:hypothetical protein
MCLLPYSYEFVCKIWKHFQNNELWCQMIEKKNNEAVVNHFVFPVTSVFNFGNNCFLKTHAIVARMFYIILFHLERQPSHILFGPTGSWLYESQYIKQI